eukprot:6016727-Pleurochrysis_carterae.AAC.2
MVRTSRAERQALPRKQQQTPQWLKQAAWHTREAGTQGTRMMRPPCSDDKAWNIPAVMAAIKKTKFATIDT